jgi:hypothetical protein
LEVSIAPEDLVAHGLLPGGERRRHVTGLLVGRLVAWADVETQVDDAKATQVLLVDSISTNAQRAL